MENGTPDRFSIQRGRCEDFKQLRLELKVRLEKHWQPKRKNWKAWEYRAPHHQQCDVSLTKIPPRQNTLSWASRAGTLSIRVRSSSIFVSATSVCTVKTASSSLHVWACPLPVFITLRVWAVQCCDVNCGESNVLWLLISDYLWSDLSMLGSPMQFTHNYFLPS